MTPEERLAELRALAAERRATMPWYPDGPETDDERAEREALMAMQSWPDNEE